MASGLIDDDSVLDPLDAVLESVTRRLRDGEPVTIDEVVAAHPGQADALRELLPAVIALERARAAVHPREGPPQVPGYQLEGELGRGAMGVVYDAVELASGARLALKLMAREAVSTEARVRFRREGETITRLDHPNIVGVAEVGEAGGRPFIAMERVDGSTLADPGRPVGWRELARIGALIARALGYAHRAGVVHRDIKPGNILLDRDGSIRLGDFGLAKLEEASELTEAGAVVGTLPYLAPELVRGEPATPSSDVYALGATLYELLSGRHPHPVRRPQELLALLGEGAQAPPLASLAPALPAALCQIVDRAIAPDPRHRHRSADALAADLEHLLAPPRPTLLARARANWGWLLALLAAALLLAALR